MKQPKRQSEKRMDMDFLVLLFCFRPTLTPGKDEVGSMLSFDNEPQGTYDGNSKSLWEVLGRHRQIYLSVDSET